MLLDSYATRFLSIMEQRIEDPKKRNDNIGSAAQIMGNVLDNAPRPAHALQFLAMLDNDRPRRAEAIRERLLSSSIEHGFQFRLAPSRIGGNSDSNQ